MTETSIHPCSRCSKFLEKPKGLRCKECIVLESVVVEDKTNQIVYNKQYKG